MSCCPPKRQWYQTKTFYFFSLLGIIILASYFVYPLEPFRTSFFSYLKIIWWAILLGLFIGGCIDAYVPKEFISYYLAAKRKRTIFYSVVFGFFMSICSHGILAIGMEIYKKGASTASVIAFLLASPWANLPLTILLIRFFGLKAFYLIACAILIAFVTGYLFQFFESRKWVESNPNTEETEKELHLRNALREKLKSGFDLNKIISGSLNLSKMVVGWIVFGTALAAVANAYLPQEIFHRYMGPTPLGLSTTLGLATLMEICSEGTAPLAFELYQQVGAFGNAFVFLMAGVVTDYTEIGLLWKNIGKKTALMLPIIAVPQVIVFGILANYLF